MKTEIEQTGDNEYTVVCKEMTKGKLLALRGILAQPFTVVGKDIADSYVKAHDDFFLKDNHGFRSTV